MTMNLEHQKQVVRRLYTTVLSEGHMEALPELIDDDFVSELGERGANGFASIVKQLRLAFPDIKYTVLDLMSEADRVAIRWNWTGTHQGALRGVQPTQRQFTNAGMAIFQLRNNRILRAWLQTDRLGFLQDLGVAQPTP